MTRTSSRIPSCAAERISTGVRHQTAGRSSGTTFSSSLRWYAARHRARAAPADDRGEHRTPERVLDRLGRVKAHVRWPLAGPGQQVEHEHDRRECGGDARQFQHQVEPVVRRLGPDQQRLLAAQRLPLQQRPDQAQRSVQRARAERNRENGEDLPPDHPIRGQPRAGTLPECHVRTLMGAAESLSPRRGRGRTGRPRPAQSPVPYRRRPGRPRRAHADSGEPWTGASRRAAQAADRTPAPPGATPPAIRPEQPAPAERAARRGRGGSPATAGTPAVGSAATGARGVPEGCAPGARRVPGADPPGARQVPGGGARHADRAGRYPLADRPVARHVALLAAFLVLGVVVTWPRPAYLVEGKLSATRDTEQYVWGFWWVAHQVTHLGNPFFTRYMAAPVGIQLGFHTLMPLPGLLLTPVTLAFGPSASLSLLTIVTPGLLCYAMYRAARLWLNAEIGAIVAGAVFGLSTIVTFQDWYHINIALGQLFLAVTLELIIRLRRRPCVRYGVVLGLVLGASFLVNQESTVMALLLAAGGLVPWFVRRPAARRLLPLVLAVVVAAVVASPQLIAMAQQEAAGGASATPALLIGTYDKFGADAGGLFAPSPRLATFGLHGLATIYSYRQADEGVPTFGLVLSVLAVAGLAAAWRRRSAWMLALLWLGGALLALGPTLVIGGKVHVPLPGALGGTPVSLLMAYTSQ